MDIKLKEIVINSKKRDALSRTYHLNKKNNLTFVKLNEILNYEFPINFIIKTKDLLNENEGKIPVLTANKAFILGYTNDYKDIYKNVPVIIFDDFTCDMKYVNFPFKVRSSAIKILSAMNANIYLYYVFYWMSYKNKLSTNNKSHKRYWISEFGKIKIPLIDINKQKLIGNFLQNIDKLIENIKNQIELNIEKREKIISKIFSFDFLNNNINEKKLINQKIEWKKLVDLCVRIKSGGTPLSSNKNFYGKGHKFAKINDISLSEKYLWDTKIEITSEGFKNSSVWLMPKDNLLYSMYGTIGLPLINKIDIVTNQNIAGIILNTNKMNLDYVYYYLIKDKAKIISKINFGVLGGMNIEVVKNIKIPLINLDQQIFIGKYLSGIDSIIFFKRNRLILLTEYKNKVLNTIFSVF